tara:strand:+ start:689 stop:2308 length:1620 start_codon:yes stop_codon:yes gene_type:complete
MCKDNLMTLDIKSRWKDYLKGKGISAEKKEELKSLLSKQTIEKIGSELKVAEMFCGPGGLAQGIKQFCEDVEITFTSVAAIDLDKNAVKIYKQNHGTKIAEDGSVTNLLEKFDINCSSVTYLTDAEEVVVLEDDISDFVDEYRIRRNAWKEVTDRKENARPTLKVKTAEAKYESPPKIKKDGLWGNIKPGEIDLLLAGPPCQGHSNLNNHTRRDDPKNELYLQVPAMAVALEIPIVIIENVEGAIRDVGGVVQKTKALLISNGYKVTGGVLSASKLGWPQTRKRYFLIARKEKLGDPIDINTLQTCFAIENGSQPLGIRDAIDYPAEKDTFTRGSIESEEGDNHMLTLPNFSPKEKLRAEYHTAKTPKKKLACINELEKIFIKEYEDSSSIRKKKMKNKKAIKKNFKELRSQLKNKELSEDEAKGNLPKRLHNETHWEKTSYPTVYGKLNWDKPAGTITSGYMCSGRGRFTHPEEARTLTPKEAAQIQGFPDDYNWKPDGEIPSATEIAQWIGDAVPMPLGYIAALSALGNNSELEQSK